MSTYGKFTNLYCLNPYVHCEIMSNGEVFPCCSDWNNSYSFGNIFEHSLAEIWTGEKAKKFREQFETRNFSYCNLNKCPLQKVDADRWKEVSSSIKYPLSIYLSYDNSCNVKCIFCREKHITKPDQRTLEFHTRVEKVLPDILPKVRTIVMNGKGEALASPEYRAMLNRISLNYPNVKFTIATNGLLFNQKLLEELNIIDKITEVQISVHAATKETYDKIVYGGDFDKVVQNLKFISEMKKQNQITSFYMHFVINSLNIHEMERFALWAKELGAVALFLNLIFNDQQDEQVYKNILISRDKYKIYNRLVKIMKNPIFKSKNVQIPPKYFHLKKVSAIELALNKFKRIFSAKN